MKCKSIITIFAALMMYSVVSFAGTTGKIAGRVTDSETGEGLVGVTVLLDGTAMGAATDMEGYYVILNISPGKYKLSASTLGYNKAAVTEVSVSVDLTTTINFKLSSSVIELKDEVVIVAEREMVKKDLTSSESRVSAGEIKTLPVQEVSAVLSLQSGVTVGRDGGIHIRGGRTSEVAYWVDGVSVSDSYDGGQAVQVDKNSLQELQVISGTFNAEYGQAMSGIVNIVTKDGGRKMHGGVSVYFGGYYTSDGTRNNGKENVLTGPSTVNLLGDGIFYNLNKYRPFDNQNIEANLNGPVPGLSDLTFYVSGRYFKSDGYLYGNKLVTTDGTIDTNYVKIIPVSPTTAKIVIGDNPVSMNDRIRYSGQAKLTYQFTPTLKLNIGGLVSKIKFHDYSHDWKINPDGNITKYDNGYNANIQLTHTLSGTSFYTVNASQFIKEFKEYLYESPFDTRYNIDPQSQTKGLYEFLRDGTNLHHFNRNTRTQVAKVDYTDQMNRLHQVKIGAEYKTHRLYLDDYTIIPVAKPSPAIGFIATIPDLSSSLHEQYTRTPVEFSLYAQDKLEYENMIVNIGVRFDYFNSNGKVLADLQDPNVYLPQKEENKGLTLSQRQAKWYKNAKAKYSVSPRFGISYPITDRGILHFSYGHFFQIPSFQYLYQKPGYKVTTSSGVQGVYGNPNLNPQKTVMYEFGLQQQIADAASFDVTGFYRDTRDWVSSSAQIPVRDAATATSYYTIFINRDYANTRGVTLSYNSRPTEAVTLNVSYTFQIAEGNNSNPEDEQAAAQANREPTKILSPLNWDQTHTANLTLGLNENHWGVFLLGRYGSGLPYSPVLNQADSRGEDASRALPSNSRRRPANYTFDLRAFKNFILAPLEFSFYIKVFNLLDRRNELDVYGETGRSTATLRALGGEVAASDPGRFNKAAEYIIRPDFYSEPREIQFGIDINF